MACIQRGTNHAVRAKRFLGITESEGASGFPRSGLSLSLRCRECVGDSSKERSHCGEQNCGELHFVGLKSKAGDRRVGYAREMLISWYLYGDVSSFSENNTRMGDGICPFYIFPSLHSGPATKAIPDDSQYPPIHPAAVKRDM